MDQIEKEMALDAIDEVAQIAKNWDKVGEMVGIGTGRQCAQEMFVEMMTALATEDGQKLAQQWIKENVR